MVSVETATRIADYTSLTACPLPQYFHCGASLLLHAPEYPLCRVYLEKRSTAEEQRPQREQCLIYLCALCASSLKMVSQWTYAETPCCHSAVLLAGIQTCGQLPGFRPSNLAGMTSRAQQVPGAIMRGSHPTFPFFLVFRKNMKNCGGHSP